MLYIYINVYVVHVKSIICTHFARFFCPWCVTRKSSRTWGSYTSPRAMSAWVLPSSQRSRSGEAKDLGGWCLLNLRTWSENDTNSACRLKHFEPHGIAKNEVLARQDGFRAIVRSSGTEQSEGGSTLFLHVFRQRTECFPVHFSFRKQISSWTASAFWTWCRCMAEYSEKKQEMGADAFGCKSFWPRKLNTLLQPCLNFQSKLFTTCACWVRCSYIDADSIAWCKDPMAAFMSFCFRVLCILTELNCSGAWPRLKWQNCFVEPDETLDILAIPLNKLVSNGLVTLKVCNLKMSGRKWYSKFSIFFRPKPP